MPSVLQVNSKHKGSTFAIPDLLKLVTDPRLIGGLKKKDGAGLNKVVPTSEENDGPELEEEVPTLEKKDKPELEEVVPIVVKKAVRKYEGKVMFYDEAKRKRIINAQIRTTKLNRLAAPKKDFSLYDNGRQRVDSEPIIEILAPRRAKVKRPKTGQKGGRKIHGDELMRLARRYEEDMIRDERARKAVLRDRVKGLLVLTPHEQIFTDARLCPALSCERPVDPFYLPPVAFSAALESKLRASQLGCFLLHLNAVQRQEREVREHKLDMARYEWTHDEGVPDRHGFTNNFQGLLEKAVELNVPIESKMIHKMIQTVRLPDCQVTHVDKFAKRLKELRFLSLVGNWLSEVPSQLLPRNINNLELYCNLISDVTNLAANLPPIVVHLGLGRNKLTNGSHLSRLKSCEHLCSLDLEDNDIVSLVPVLRSLHRIPRLAALSLQGNPCS